MSTEMREVMYCDICQRGGSGTPTIEGVVGDGDARGHG